MKEEQLQLTQERTWETFPHLEPISDFCFDVCPAQPDHARQRLARAELRPGKLLKAVT